MFSVSEYLSRIERAYLDILEGLEPVSKAITLWLGLDGLRINEDGSTEWVSRKKPTERAIYQPCQSIQAWTGQTQSTRAQMEALMNQCQVSPMQSWKSMQTANVLQQCCAQAPAYYAPYYYAGCGCSFMG